jgi:putative inorganic carbon (HCO3(-)) transporter
VPLRELALFLIVGAICCAALFRPQIGLYGYFWFAICVPDVMAWCPGKYPFSLCLAAATLAGTVRYLPEIPNVLKVPAVKWLLLLQVPLALSVIFSEGPFLAMDRYLLFERTTLMVLLIPVLIDSEERMRNLILTFVISAILLGGRFGTYGLVHGGVLLDGGYGSVYDNNDLALAIAMLVPVCWQYQGLTKQLWLKLALWCTIIVSTGAVIMTNSRGSSLSLGVIFLCRLLRSRHRIAVLVLVALALGPALYLVKDQYFDRMETISSYQEGAQNDGGRLALWNVAIHMISDHPFLGVGFGQRNFISLVPHYMYIPDLHAVHNTYLQMWVDSGIFALLIYGGLLFGTLIWLGRSIKRSATWRPELVAIPLAIQEPLIGFSVGCLFYSQQRNDLTYVLLMCAAAWYRIQNSQEEHTAPAEQPVPELAEMAAVDVQR